MPKPHENLFINKTRMCVAAKQKSSLRFQIATCNSTLQCLEETIDWNFAKAQLVGYSAILRAKLLEGYADLRDGLTLQKWCSGSSTGARCFWDDVMTFAGTQKISIEMLIIKFLEEAQPKKIREEKQQTKLSI